MTGKYRPTRYIVSEMARRRRQRAAIIKYLVLVAGAAIGACAVYLLVLSFAG